MRIKSKIVASALGILILSSTATYSSVKASTNETDLESQITIVEEIEDDEVEAQRLRLMWEGAKTAYRGALSAADHVGMWLLGGSSEGEEINYSEDLEVIFDK